MPVTTESLTAAWIEVGLDIETLSPRLLDELTGASQPTTLGNVGSYDLSTRRIVFTPLNDDEARIVESFLPAGPQMKFSMTSLVNDLLAVALGAAWSHVANGGPARMRLNRGSHRGDFSRLHEHVEQHPHVFSAERVEAFRRVAAMETAIADRRH